MKKISVIVMAITLLLFFSSCSKQNDNNKIDEGINYLIDNDFDNASICFNQCKNNSSKAWALNSFCLDYLFYYNPDKLTDLPNYNTSLRCFWAYYDSVLYYTADGGIFGQSLIDSSNNKIYDESVNYIKVYKDLIYFIKDKKLYSMNLDGKNVKQVIIDDVDDYIFYNDNIYYINKSNNDALCEMSLVTGDISVIKSYAFSIKGLHSDYLFYSDMENLYAMDLSNSHFNSFVIDSEYEVFYNYIFTEKEILIARNNLENSDWHFSLYTMQYSNMNDQNFTPILINRNGQFESKKENYIYYFYNDSLWKVRDDGINAQKIE